MTAPALPPVRCFMSYVHQDDDDFRIVEPLTGMLTAMFVATTGRPLEIFVDRDKIGWGEDWREKISTSVEEAVVFIPVVTARYFESRACREEILAFYAKSAEMGVTDLLLPIVLMGADLLSDESPDEVVRIVERLQYRDIKVAWLAGFESAAWRTALSSLAEDLRRALDRAESVIALSEARSEGRVVATLEGKGAEEEKETFGAFDLMVEFNDEVDAMTACAEGMSAAIEAFGAVPQGWTPPETDSAKVMQRALITLAARFKAPSQELEDVGRELNSHASKADSHLRSLVSLAESAGVEDLRTALREGVSKIGETLGDSNEVAVQMEELLESFKAAEVMNVSLRKSLRPARVGITNVRDAINTLTAWAQLVD